MTNSTTLGSSTTGSVLAMQQTAVKPPAAAAAVPVAIVSFSSFPGSRRWVWISMKPGARSIPDASRTGRSVVTLFCQAISAISPLRTSRQPVRIFPPSGSAIFAPAIQNSFLSFQAIMSSPPLVYY